MELVIAGQDPHVLALDEVIGTYRTDIVARVIGITIMIQRPSGSGGSFGGDGVTLPAVLVGSGFGRTLSPLGSRPLCYGSICVVALCPSGPGGQFHVTFHHIWPVPKFYDGNGI
jgi:hypothetical protein